MKKLIPLIVFTMLFSLLPAVGQAQIPTLYGEADPYANDVNQASNQTLYPTKAIGAPDLLYADFLKKEESLRLDMGEGEEGTGDLLIYYRRLGVQARYYVRFEDDTKGYLASSEGFLPDNSGFITLEYSGETPYRYVFIQNTKDPVWSVDAIEALDYVGLDGETPEIPIEPEVPINPLRGQLVKLENDGNPETTYDTTVYVIGEDNTRHAFSSASVFFSWYPNFDEVIEIDAATMASHALGKNVTIRPGTYLVKIATDPKTYAVEPGGILRWVATESIAKMLYGSEWAKRVVDVSDVYFGNYVKGDPIETSLHPEGTVGITPNGQIVYLRNSVYYSIGGQIFDAMRFARDEFLTNIHPDVFKLYIDGGGLADDPTIKWPY